ncbi:MCE family protein [Endozoicomonas sp. SM1973]|uniref:MCE family protein n=1 Tax=Spartinivicinus marinus TaxID=2994442 RepID=A0A853IA71_9GAMM|nr:MlaD family protein [Spartinivicinus marinus]MCX4024908.1 MlaD family protein [Spartinivicinus marinus]NYZ66447.1 MCE family protein [Spartinivicinus marinus]
MTDTTNANETNSPIPQPPLPEPIISQKKGISPIWLLPFIALLIGGWIIYKGIRDAGVDIVIQFESGSGIVAGKTEVLFRGLRAGVVKKVVITDDLSAVDAVIEMDAKTESLLTENTQFWLVKPRISVAEVSGLETLVSGNYIAIRPGEGVARRRFTAQTEPPPVEDETGLHIRLQAKELGSLDRDSPVFYKKLIVGKVVDYNLADDLKNVNIEVLIDEKYRHLVKKNSRFWNASGISFKGDLSGFKFRTESLASLIAGGIAFYTPDTEPQHSPVNNLDEFVLYDDFEAAEAGILARIRFKTGRDLIIGKTKVIFEGLTAGVVKDVSIMPDLQGVYADILFDPRAEPALNESTQFWLVKPKIGIAGITGLDALIKGNYIAMRIGDPNANEPKREFTALNAPPPLPLDTPGLHLTLFSDELDSIDIGSTIYYKKIPVGTVKNYQLAKEKQQVEINIHIKPEYQHLVQSHSRFWHSSGIEISGGLSGLKVRTESMTAIFAGGISFYTPPVRRPKAVKNGASFKIYEDYDSAHQIGYPITITFKHGDGLSEGTVIKYQGIQVGKITKVKLIDQLSKVQVRVMLNPEAERLARKGTKFWVVKPELGLAKTAHLDTLVTGKYIEAAPAKGNPPRVRAFKGLDEAPQQATTPLVGFKVMLAAKRLGAIQIGNPVFYRDVQVGKVTGYQLSPKANEVYIALTIKYNYAPLIRANSKFWNVSGIGVDFSLFGGAKIKAGTLESIIAGGIAFATPNNNEMGKLASPKQYFTLHDEADPKWLEWRPEIEIK